jgi:hypothetical protein
MNPPATMTDMALTRRLVSDSDPETECMFSEVRALLLKMVEEPAAKGKDEYGYQAKTRLTLTPRQREALLLWISDPEGTDADHAEALRITRERTRDIKAAIIGKLQRRLKWVDDGHEYRLKKEEAAREAANEAYYARMRPVWDAEEDREEARKAADLRVRIAEGRAARLEQAQVRMKRLDAQGRAYTLVDGYPVCVWSDDVAHERKRVIQELLARFQSC